MVISIYALLLLALFYNALLAFVNANVMAVSGAYVMLMEVLVISIGAVWIVRRIRLDFQTRKVLAFLIFFVTLYSINCVLAMFGGGGVSLKPIRDISIIFTFLLLGYYSAKKKFDVSGFVVFSASAVVLFLIIELIWTDIYIQLFNVSSYYINTRDVSERVAYSSRGESGLFFTAQGYDGRFTFGFRQAQRLASLFLEQTTNANFASVLGIFLTVFWNRLKFQKKLILVTTVVLIILGTDSRQGFGICLILLLGYRVFPKLPKVALYFYMPTMLLLMFIIFYDFEVVSQRQDNVVGRLTYSIERFMGSDTMAAFGMRMTERVVDSGFTYILYSHSVFGLIGFWIFICRIMPYHSVESRRLAHGVMVFYTINLAVSGSTIFSMKTSALLWFVIGICCVNKYEVVERFPRHVLSKDA